MIDERANWFAVLKQPNAEAKALAHLDRQGFEGYLPRFLKRRRHAGKTDYVAKALFPSYLFVSVDTGAQRWRAINSTVGVRKLVCNGDTPAVVDPEIIAQLRRQHDETGFIKLESGPRFAAGDAVRVTEGAFSDLFGIYEGMSDGERVAILLDLLGRKVRVRIGIDLVVAV